MLLWIGLQHTSSGRFIEFDISWGCRADAIVHVDINAIWNVVKVL